MERRSFLNAVLVAALGACVAPTGCRTGPKRDAGPPTYYVFGDFDLDHAGVPRPGDRQRVQAMITAAGGKLADELGPGVDFVVLGVEPEPPPRRPTGIGGGNLDDLARWARNDKRAREYADLRARAKKLRVPILRQDEFVAQFAHGASATRPR